MQNQELNDKVLDHDITLYGKDGEMGLTHKVNVIWRVHVWLLCLLSAVVGGVVVHWFKV